MRRGSIHPLIGPNGAGKTTQFDDWVTVITGAIFVACVLRFRRGLLGELARLFPPRSR